MSTIEKNIHFMLVRPQFASNLGSAVRVLGNMGFENLSLIAPECEVGAEARARSMKAAPILDRARFFPSLAQARSEPGILVGTTARVRDGQDRCYDCRTFARSVLPELEGRVSVVFGPEDNGLRREEMRLCQYLISIPTISANPVMNLAQAVAVVAYEFRLALCERSPHEERKASESEVQELLDQVNRTLRSQALPAYLSVARLMRRFQTLTARAHLESEDVRMLLSLLRDR